MRKLLSALRALTEQPEPLELTATPGLMTILDRALFLSVEGELTATICASHALLASFLDIKEQARILLRYSSLPTKQEAFCRMCLEAACDAIEKLSTDNKLAASANVTDAYEASGSFSSTGMLSGHVDVSVSSEDTGRRLAKAQRPRDCWETCRLICPDFVWGDDAFLTCQRLLRHLSKQIVTTSGMEDQDWQGELALLHCLLQQDLPVRLHQFRAALEANSVVTKRLYLVKSEYRAPFRAFLEAHQTVQRAPSLELVELYISKKARQDNKLEELLKTPQLVEALTLERQLETLEANMAKELYGFTELARLLDHRRVTLKPISHVLEEENVQDLQDLLRRLKWCLCRKAGPETSSGIRPILLDLEGVPRDEDSAFKSDNLTFEDRLTHFLKQIKTLQTLCGTPKAFVLEKRGEMDVPSAIAKSCAEFSVELWQAECEDWMMLVQKQQTLAKSFPKLSEKIRRAEMEMSISAASPESLGVVRQRLELISQDRQKRFEVLKEMIEEVCLREMKWRVSLKAPEKDTPLELPATSVLGLLGLPLQLAGEPLPLG